MAIKTFYLFSDEMELVLFKYKNQFYRGQVQGMDSQGINISFVDYGYELTIEPSDIYQWHPRWNIIPGKSFEIYPIYPIAGGHLNIKFSVSFL